MLVYIHLRAGQFLCEFHTNERKAQRHSEYHHRHSHSRWRERQCSETRPAAKSGGCGANSIMGREKSRSSGRKDQAAWDIVRGIAAGHLRRMVRLRAKITRAGKPGAIHDFRVATRRFQQAFDLLLPSDAPAALLDLRRDVVRARRALSAVRDCDVSIAFASAHLAASRSASREMWKLVAEFLSQRRPQKYRRAVRKLRRLDLERAFVRLRAVLEPSPKGSRRVFREGGHLLQPERFTTRLPEELRRLSNAYGAASRAAASAPSTPAIHKLRVAVKRLRYLVEIARRFNGAQSREALRILRSFQETLGDWHDHETEVRLLTKLAKRPERLRRKSSARPSVRKALEQGRARIVTLKRRRPWALDRAQSRRLEADLLALAQRLAASGRVEPPALCHAPRPRK